MSNVKIAEFTAPGIKDNAAKDVISVLDDRMVALIDL